MTARHLVTGTDGEDAAARHLNSRGYRILHRNWRHGRLELDIICRKGATTVFVEVKTRSRGALQSPAEALTRAKRSTLVRAAQHFLSASGLWNSPSRFDLVAVVRDGDAYLVEHTENAFDLSEPVGGGNAAWQPW